MESFGSTAEGCRQYGDTEVGIQRSTIVEISNGEGFEKFGGELRKGLFGEQLAHVASARKIPMEVFDKGIKAFLFDKKFVFVAGVETCCWDCGGTWH